MTVNAYEGRNGLAAQLEGGDPVLSKKARQLNTGEYLTDAMYYAVDGVVIGLTFNPAFNKGVERGPWIAPDSDVQWCVKKGLSEVDALAYLELRKKLEKIEANTKPFGTNGELTVLSKQLKDEAGKIALRACEPVE